MDTLLNMYIKVAEDEENNHAPPPEQKEEETPKKQKKVSAGLSVVGGIMYR